MTLVSNAWMHRKCIEPVKRAHGNGLQWQAHRFEIKGGISFREAISRDLADPRVLLVQYGEDGKIRATFRSIPIRIVEAA